MTDNAVRSHLLTLERDGLVRQGGVQRGHRKPHFAYELTPEAEQLFTKAYDALLNVLLSVLKERLAPDELGEVLREAGRRTAADKMTILANGSDISAKDENAVEVLEALGGAARLEKGEGKIIINR